MRTKVEKWPIKGWTHQGIEDLKEAKASCQFCPQERIRYVHHLTHETGLPIQVGCVCATFLTGNPEIANLEKQFLSAIKKKENFIYSSKWQLSKKGNYWRPFEGRTCIVTFKAPHTALIYSGPDKILLGTFEKLTDAYGACFEYCTSGPESFFKNKGNS